MKPTSDLIAIPTFSISKVEDVTRRTLITGAFAAALLAACGGDDDEDTATPEATPASRFIDTAFGSIEVPARPQRVVSMATAATYSLLDLGLVPVGSRLPTADFWPAHHSAKLASVVDVDPGTAVDLEIVANLNPDLIIGLKIDAAPYDLLSPIAPTALVDPSVSWERWVEFFALATGREPELAEIRKRYAGRVAELRAAHQTVLAVKKWAMVFGESASWRIYHPDTPGGSVLKALGGQFGGQVNGSGIESMLSFEQFGRLGDADAIAAHSTDGKTIHPATAALLARPGFASLPAVRAGRVYPVPVLLQSHGEQLIVLDALERGLTDLERRS